MATVNRGVPLPKALQFESVETPAGPRQNTICSLGDLKPRPRQEWLALARKLEDGLAGQADLLRPSDPALDRFVAKAHSRQTAATRLPPPIAPPAAWIARQRSLGSSDSR